MIPALISSGASVKKCGFLVCPLPHTKKQSTSHWLYLQKSQLTSTPNIWLELKGNVSINAKTRPHTVKNIFRLSLIGSDGLQY